MHLPWQSVAATLPVPLMVVDIGARGGVEGRWAGFGSHIHIYGFEPEEAEYDRLTRENKLSSVTYFPFAIGSVAGEQRFYVTKDPLCSSLFRPLERLVRERPRLVDMALQEVTSLQTRTIDDWADEYAVPRLDHLKIDAQGAELAILGGAARSLDTARSINLEVQFSQLYEDTPLFGEVDRFLRKRGFVLWRLSELSHCGFEDAASGVEVREVLDYDSRRVEVSAGGGQLLWANAYYVRRETATLGEHIGWEDAVRDGCLAAAHDYMDLAAASLRRALPEAPEDKQVTIRSTLDNPSSFGTRWVDPIERMQAAIDELKQAADERLRVINELHEAAAERLRALEATTVELEDCQAELDKVRFKGV